MNPHAKNIPAEDEIRVLVVDDHTIIRKGMKAVLELAPDIKIIGEAGNGLEALQQAEKLHPDVILMDLVMPEMDGIEATRQIKALQSEVRILVLTTFTGEELIFPAIKAGALGYQLKDSSPEALVEAIRQVYRGEPSLHPIIARKVLQELLTPSEKPPTSDPLTQREVEVLRLIAQGFENKEIAEKLVISEATTRTHVSNILSKLHLASRTQAALYALREGLASLENPSEGH
jgi:NarL family two-component system response regulator LiaR